MFAFEFLTKIMQFKSETKLLNYWESFFQKTLDHLWVYTLREGENFEKRLYEQIIEEILGISGINDARFQKIRLKQIEDIIRDFTETLAYGYFKEVNSVGELTEYCRNLNFIPEPLPDRKEELAKILDEKLKNPILNGFSKLLEAKSEVKETLQKLKGYILIILATKFLLQWPQPITLFDGNPGELKFTIKRTSIGNRSFITIFAKMMCEDINFELGKEGWNLLLSATKEIESAIKENTKVRRLKEPEFWAKCLRLIEKGREEEYVKEILSILCSVSKLKNKGDEIKDVIASLTQKLYLIIKNEENDEKMLCDLFNFMVLQHGVLEYQVLKFLANFDLACLPRVEFHVYTKTEDDEKKVIDQGEIDLIVFSHEIIDERINLVPAFCIEITASRTDKEIRNNLNKLRRAISYLERVFPTMVGKIYGIVFTPNFIVFASSTDEMKFENLKQ